MFFVSVFAKETDTTPEFHTPSKNAIDSVSFIVNNVENKLKELNPYKSVATTP